MLTHAAVVLRDQATRHPIAVSHTLARQALRTVRLAVAILPVAARAPTTRIVHVPVAPWTAPDRPVDFEVVRQWRDGRWGWLNVDTGKWYASVTIAGAATITAAVAGGAWTTNGSWVGSVAPTPADDVLLTATSGAMTVSASSLCRSLNMTGYANTLSGSGDLSIGDASGGACTLGGTISGSWTTSFVSTSNNGGTGWALTSSGKAFPGAVTINGAGNKMICQDAFTCGSNTLTVTSGAFFGNGQTITCGIFAYSGSTTRTVDITNCTITCSGAGTSWSGTTTTLLTLTTTGSSITQTGVGPTFNGGSKTFNNVTMSGSGTRTFNGTNTFTTFTVNGSANKTDVLTLSNGFTATTFVISPNSLTNSLLIQSSTVGTPRTITAGTVTIGSGRVDYKDITAAGAASWDQTSTASIGDCLGNTGITFTPAATRYAVVAGNTSATATWSASSGGGGGSSVPLPQDTVNFDANSGAGTYTFDMPRIGKDVSFNPGGSGFTRTAAFSSTTNEMYGSITLVSGMTISGTQTLTLAGRGTHTITSAGATFSQGVTINGPSGTYTLQDALTISRSATAFTLTNGTFVDNGKSVTISGALGTITQNGNSSTLTKTGAWSFATTGAVTFWTNTGGTVTDTGTITLSATSANTRIFAGGGQSYGTLTYTVAGSTGQLTISGSNTFSTINFSDASNARTLALTAATTTKISTYGGLNVVGTSGKLMSLVSTTGGAAATIAYAGGRTVNWASIQDITGTWPIYVANSTNVSGNTNIVFGTMGNKVRNRLSLTGR